MPCIDIILQCLFVRCFILAFLTYASMCFNAPKAVSQLETIPQPSNYNLLAPMYCFNHNPENAKKCIIRGFGLSTIRQPLLRDTEPMMGVHCTSCLTALLIFPGTKYTRWRVVREESVNRSAVGLIKGRCVSIDLVQNSAIVSSRDMRASENSCY